MKKICLWAHGGIWGGKKTKILETIQNTTSFLPQNLQPQISQNKNPKTNKTQAKTFLAQREENAICFFLYSLSALLRTSGNVQCLQISCVTLNVFAIPPELSWKKSLISKLEHQAEPKTYLRASVLSRDGGAGRVWDLSSNSVSWMTKTRRNLLTPPPNAFFSKLILKIGKEGPYHWPSLHPLHSSAFSKELTYHHWNIVYCSVT